MIGIIKLYLFNCLYAVDVLVNVLVGGDRRDTISSRLGKGMKAGKPVHSILCKVVDKFFLLVFKEDHHCFRSIEYLDDRYAISSYISRFYKGQ